ncbi:MAG: hypothetical protein IJ960_05005 [Oscillospiraceae bacterium]|nr:hypothetical protein [Oscillospiraceae bacterium]
MASKWICAAAAMFYILAIVLCALEYPRRRQRENGVYLPAFYVWVGLVCGGVFTVFGFLSSGSGLFAATVFSCFAVLSSLLMLGWCNSFLVYDEEGFYQYNLIGMRRRFRYEQVTGWDTHSGHNLEASVYVLGKKVTFSWLSAQSAGFVVALKKGYRRTHGGKNLPAKRRTEKRTGFSSHVRYAGEFLFVFLMLLVFFVGMGGWCIWMIWEPLDGSDCETMNLSFRSSVVEEDTLILDAEGYVEPFEIRGYPEYVSRPDGIRSRCDGETVFTAQARRVDPDDGPDYYWIQSLTDEGTAYLTLDDTTAQKRTALPLILWFFGGCLGVLLAFAGLMYRVGCDPSRYPQWLVNALFKKGYIIW